MGLFFRYCTHTSECLVKFQLLFDFYIGFKSIVVITRVFGDSTLFL